MKRKIWLDWIREESGSALVEFAVTSVLLMLLLFAVFQGMFAMYIYHYTAWAAQQGARFAMVRGHTWSVLKTTSCNTAAPPNFVMIYGCEAQTSDIQNYVQSLGAINSSSLTINTTSSYVWPGTNPDGTTTGCTGTSPANSKNCMVKVTTYYTFNLLPYMSATSIKMGATSEKVIAQ